MASTKCYFTTNYSQIHKTATGQSKITVSVHDLDGKTLVSHSFAARQGETDAEFEMRIRASEKDILANLADDILQKMQAQKDSYITLGAYVALRERVIPFQAHWARTALEYWDIWHTKLDPSLGDLPLNDCSNDNILLIHLARIANCKGAFRATGENNIKLVTVLYDLLHCAVQEGLINTQTGKYPLSTLNYKAHQRLSTIASSRLSLTSLSINDSKKAIHLCIEHSAESDAYLAVIIALLTACTAPEICGLNIGSLVDHGSYGWLEIAQMYRQYGNRPPVLTILLDYTNAYRRYPATDTLRAIWNLQVERQRKKGFSAPTDPLLVGSDGQRLTPAELRKVRNAVLDQIISGGAKMHDKKGGSILTGENRPSISRIEFLRSSAKYYLRDVCEVDDTDVRVLLGCAGKEVYARHYVDWDNHRLLRRFAKTIQDKWHGQICTPTELEELIK